jgi:hypothetical protein
MHCAQCFCVEKRPPTEHANKRGILPSSPTEMQNCLVSLHRGKSFILLSLSPSSIRKQRSSVVHRRGGRGDLHRPAGSPSSRASRPRPRRPGAPRTAKSPGYRASRPRSRPPHESGAQRPHRLDPHACWRPGAPAPAPPCRGRARRAGQEPRSRVPTLASSIQAPSSPVLNRALPRPPNRDGRC